MVRLIDEVFGVGKESQATSILLFDQNKQEYILFYIEEYDGLMRISHSQKVLREKIQSEFQENIRPLHRCFTNIFIQVFEGDKKPKLVIVDDSQVYSRLIPDCYALC